MTEDTYKDYLSRIKRWAYKYSIQDVEDLFHDAYLKYLKQENPEDITISWFFRVMQNDHYKKHKKSTSKFFQDDNKLAKQIVYAKPEATDWDEIYTRYSELRNKLDDCLTEREREAVYYAYLGKLGRREISQRMGCSVAVVGNLIHRSLKEFKE